MAQAGEEVNFCCYRTEYCAHPQDLNNNSEQTKNNKVFNRICMRTDNALRPFCLGWHIMVWVSESIMGAKLEKDALKDMWHPHN